MDNSSNISNDSDNDARKSVPTPKKANLEATQSKGCSLRLALVLILMVAALIIGFTVKLDAIGVISVVLIVVTGILMIILGGV